MLAQIQLPPNDQENDGRLCEDDQLDSGSFGCADGKVLNITYYLMSSC